MEQQTGSKVGKEYFKAVYCHPGYLTYMQSTSCEMLGWVKDKLESSIAVRNVNNLRYADDTTLMIESKEELKNLLMKVKEENEKAGLKFKIQKNKIMASDAITSWHRWGNSGNSDRLYFFLVSKITADGNCSHEIKRHLFPGRKAMTNLDSVLKSRDLFADKGPYSQSYGFSNSHVWMSELDHKED